VLYVLSQKSAHSFALSVFFLLSRYISLKLILKLMLFGIKIFYIIKFGCIPVQLR
jgi:hypothetical protein